MPTYLVTGATGNIGRHVVAGLRARGAAVRALSRFPAAAGLPLGVEVVAGDLTDPAAVRAATEGVDAVFLLWPFLGAEHAAAAVDALTASARRVVYVSAMNADRGVWGEVEQVIREADVDWTFLRPGGFATNTLEWAPAVRGGRPVRIPFLKARRSLIHEQDIADVAVRVLTEDGHTGRAYVLTGPEAIAQDEQVRILGEVAGRPAAAEEISAEQARVQMLAWADAAFADAALDYWAALEHTPEPVTDTVERLTGRPARTFETWARDHIDDIRPLPAADVADRYVKAFAAGRMDRALRLTSPDLVRVAPLENGGERTEVRGLADILANSERLNGDIEIVGLRVDGPFVGDDRFAVRFSFDERRASDGRISTTAKMCLYTVEDGSITREEVFYHDAPPGVRFD